MIEKKPGVKAVKICEACGLTERECVCCESCGHDCALNRGEPWCPVCFPRPMEPMGEVHVSLTPLGNPLKKFER